MLHLIFTLEKKAQNLGRKFTAVKSVEADKKYELYYSQKAVWVLEEAENITS